MALIFAFRDESGEWHGDPHADTDWPAPRTGHLTYRPAAGTPEAASLFAGQRLEVLYAAMEGPPGPAAYQLDDGPRLYATWAVYELLDEPYEVTEEPPVPAAAAPVHLVLADHGRRYELTLTETGDERLHLEATGCTAEGEFITEVQGTVPRQDLLLLGRLLLAGAARRSTPAPGADPSRRTWEPWSAEEEDTVRMLAEDGLQAVEIAAKLGRTERSIGWKLYRMRLGPRPGNDTTEASRPPSAKPQPAYTMDDLRRKHPNSHKPWTHDDDALLITRSKQGHSISELMEEFGRNRGAIEARLARLNTTAARTPQT